MNPASTGGGRGKLPRSVESYFLQVQLANFEVLELMHITIALLRSHVEAGYLTNKFIEKINLFHYDISEKVRLRQIGHVGRPNHFNLRDIEKLSNLIGNLSVTHRAHFNLSDQSNENDPIEMIEEQNIIESLHVYLNIVYACRFESMADQTAVRQLIDQYFPPAFEFQRSTTIDYDLNLLGYVRLGFVYIEKKDHPATTAPCVHSPRTLEHLQILATGVVSKATVLIEGDDCSGKTGIVCELARLCGRRLLMLNLNHETTTSDLLGSWTVINKNSHDSRRTQQSRQFLNEFLRLTLAELLKGNERYIEQIISIVNQWEKRRSTAASRCDLFFRSR